jgi:hypothetical protein
VVGFGEVNGTYNFSFAPVPGFEPSPANGSLRVNGGPAGQAVTYFAAPTEYILTFAESGLPASTRWDATVGSVTLSSTGRTLNFTVAPGAQGYEIGAVPGYQSTPTSGSANVLDANVTIPVLFTKLPPGQYSVIFTESGLAIGTNWSVTLDDKLRTSTGATVAFSEANGSYDYSIATPRGYTTGTSSGSVIVRGSNIGETVVFAAIPPGKFALTFTETGLPIGTNWSVSVGGTLAYSNGGDVVSFQEANGTISYAVSPVTGYIPVPAAGSVSLSGSGRNVNVAFSPATGPSSWWSGLSLLDWVALGVALLLVLVAIAGFLGARSRKKREPPAEVGPGNDPSGDPGPDEGDAH